MVSKLHNKMNVTPEKNGNVSKELRKNCCVEKQTET